MKTTRAFSIIGLAVLTATVFLGSRLQATGNLEVITQGGSAIGNRAWNDISLPIVWRFHDPSTFAGCYSNTNAAVVTLQPASLAGFNAWQNDPDSKVAFSYGGTTTTRSVGADGVNVVTWCDAAVLASNLQFLAQTPTTALASQMTVTAGGGCPAGQGILDANGPQPPAGFCFPVGTFPAGTIIDGDVRFNSFSNFEQVNFSTNNAPGSADVQATATHENGHIFGLSHDPAWQAVMFAFIDDVPDSDSAGGQRVLKRLDLNTSGRYYPEATYGSNYGSITGFISLDGVDADGVHVVAIDPTTMLAVAGRFSISRFEDPLALGSEGPDFAANGAGFYRIDGLPPGNYYVYVEYFEDSDFFSGRLANRYNTTVGNSNVSNGNPDDPNQIGAWLGFIPQLTEFYNTGDSGNGGDGASPGTALDNSDVATLVSVAAGAVTSNVNIAINIEPVNGQIAGNRENPTTRTIRLNDNFSSGDEITAFLFDGGGDDFYAVKFPAASLPAPPYNVAEGKWVRGGKNVSPFVARLAFEDPLAPGFPAMNDPIVSSSGRVLSGGPNGATAGGDFIDVRDQWNVTVNQSRDVWIILNQPPSLPGITFITQGSFYIVTRTPPVNNCRVCNTLASQDGGATWGTLLADVFYDLITEDDPPVMITSASPAAMQEGQTGDVDISGAGFVVGATADFGSGVTVNTCNRLSGALLRCNITVVDTGATMSHSVNLKVISPGAVFPNVSRVFTVEPGDADNDGLVNLFDCNPLDATLKHPATDVMNITIGGGDTSSSVSWDSQDALNGTGTMYDIVSGLAGDLRPSMGYGAAACASNDDADTPFNDANPLAVGGIRYWIMRAHNGCNAGPGSYGDSNIMPDPRDALDAGAPCAN